ncbi:MAG: hypothetical protein ABR520_02035 [Mycobacteriales bacterium]|nr:hypothetical protein [Frankia sp.]
MPRRLLAAATLLAVATACTSDGEPSAARSSTTGAPAASATATLSPPHVVIVDITVRDGKRVGALRRVKVRRGERVRIVVTSDAVDEVHAHIPGKSLRATVGPSGPATLGFAVNVAGVFEVELEKRHVVLVELEVR